ncbi:MAG: class I SAM-dependent methyltransferase [Spirochaetales bacterium]|nr:class I SAM-dependent methyltransferase [Spirochaetales bacterium]
MENAEKFRVCPVEHAGALDNIFRKLVQHPGKIAGKYIKPGMSVLDFGCGPGFFSIEMARKTGRTGTVIAADIQQEMLDKVKAKIDGTGLEETIRLYKTNGKGIQLNDTFDFILVFYVLHEVKNQPALLKQLKAHLKPSGRILVVEPGFHVSKEGFEKSLDMAEEAGLQVIKRPRYFLSRAALMGH